MLKKLSSILLCTILLLSLYPATTHNVAYANSEQLTVHASVLNLREGPGLSYPVVKQLKNGDSLSLIEARGDWYKVQAKDATGWVASWMTRTNEQQNNAVAESYVTSTVDNLNFRLAPELSSTVLTQLSRGQQAIYIKEQDDWVQIKYNEQIGWVSKQYVSITNAATSTSNESTQTIESSKQFFTVNVSAVNIRKKASLNAKKLGTIKLNEQFEVLSRTDNWIEIEYAKGKKGWVYSFYGTFSSEVKKSTSNNKEQKFISILYDGTNLREEPSTQSNVVARAKIGEQFEVIEINNDWYKIKLANKKEAYVANWVVQSSAKKQNESKQEVTKIRKKGTLNGLTIVIDPGHGGNDQGTVGVHKGTPEKSINLLTADLLKAKLRAAGAEVVMTRESDKYVDLRKRVSISNQHNTDAFISIHYDASDISSVQGFTTYYTNSNQRKLADAVHKGIAGSIQLNDRGVQPGNYLVLRENRSPAILLELGFLSNRAEERKITTDLFREQATQGIYNGLIQYFDSQLK